MSLLKTCILAATVSMITTVSADAPGRIVVDCASPHALERALDRAKKRAPVDIYLQGVCEGNYRIDTDGVTLRGVTSDSGIAAPAGGGGDAPVLEIEGAKVSLRGLLVRGGLIGVRVRGIDAEVLLFETEVYEQTGVGLIAEGNSSLRILDTTIRDASLGILVASGSSANLQRVTVSGQDVGIAVFDRSFSAINDSIIRDNRGAGLDVDNRSDVNIIGTTFHENGDVHVNANDWSSVRVLWGVTLGSATDSTRFSLGANRESTIMSYLIPEIFGGISVLVGSSVRFGEVTLHGDLSVIQFADAHVRHAEITGSVFCSDGADAICRQTTTGGMFGCPSPSCAGGARATQSPPTAPAPPVFDESRHKKFLRSGGF